jgi:heptosyltransferase III
LKNILIARGGAIGDFILTLPVLEALRRELPQSRIELLANPSIASLAVEFNLADHIRDLGSASFAPMFSPGGECTPEIAAWLSTFDLVISYLHDPEKVFETNLRRNTKAQLITGPHRPDERCNIHATLQLLQPLRAIADVSFEVQSSMFDVQRSPSSHTLALHPGSGSHLKNWPAANWLTLLDDLLRNTSANFLLIAGEAERDRLSMFIDAIPSNRRQVAFNLPLVDLARRLKTCRAFIGHDSGVTHLAAVLGLESVVLWGPSNEQVWRPLGKRVHVLRHPLGLTSLPVATVSDAVAFFPRHRAPGIEILIPNP